MSGLYNSHFGCTCYHPLFCFNHFGDVERVILRKGNGHSADDWRSVMARYRDDELERFADHRWGRGSLAEAAKLWHDRRIVVLTTPSSVTRWRLTGKSPITRPLRLLSFSLTAVAGFQLQHMWSWSPTMLAVRGLLSDDAFFYAVLAENHERLGFLPLVEGQRAPWVPCSTWLR